MKLHLISTSILFSLVACFVAGPLSAQSEPAPTGKPVMTEKKAKHHDRVARDLKLSDDQKAKFHQIDEEYAAKAREKRAARKEEQAKIREEKIKAHKAVLTSEQAARYDEMLAKKKAKHDRKKQAKSAKKKAHKQDKSERKAIKEELKRQ